MIAVLAAAAAGVCAAAGVVAVVRPGWRFRYRVLPYVAPGAAAVDHARPRRRRLGHDAVGDEVLAARLARAGIDRDVSAEPRVVRHRTRRSMWALAGLVAGLVAGSAAGWSPPVVLIGGGVGAVAAATWFRGRLDKMIERRRDTMRIELYTVDLVLALRASLGEPVAALVESVSGASGEVAGELREVAQAARAGRGMQTALRSAARVTTEPHAARLYRALASGEAHGVGLGQSLLSLASDVREARRDALRRAATRRRALMLVPIVAVLAPVLLLFIAAPLPWIVFGGLE